MEATPNYDDQHACLVQFFKDQADLDEELLGPSQVFDYVIILNKDRVEIGAGSRIDSFVKIEGGQGVRIGRGVHVASGAHLGIGGGSLEIGDFAAVGSGGRVITGSNDVDARSMSAVAPAHMQRTEKKRTVIGKFAVVLTNATVLPGVTLGEGAVLDAGSVATRDIPAWQVWAGVPARFLRMRRGSR